LVYTVLLSMSVSFLCAQDRKGIDFYEIGDYSTAKSFLIKNGATDAVSHFYLGDIYFKEKKIDSAQYYFQKGLEIDPESIFNKIGLAKVLLAKTRSTEELNKIAREKKNKRNGTVLT